MDQLIIAKSFSDVPLCFFALCPVRTNKIFRFLASFFFNCFFTFFLAAMSGFTTACHRKKKIVRMYVLRNYFTSVIKMCDLDIKQIAYLIIVVSKY